MATLISKDKKDIYIDCDCGCNEGIRFQIEKFDENDSFCFMTFTNGNFYRDQNDTVIDVFRKKFKKIWAIIRNKDFYYSDVILNKSDFEDFKEYINSIGRE